MMTANDALITKVYAESMGYFTDPFVGCFLEKKKKMYPIINRGTWARVYSIRQVIQRFLALYADQKVNIVSLGCGYDSTFFWLNNPEQLASYVEVDFKDVV